MTIAPNLSLYLQESYFMLERPKDSSTNDVTI